MKYGAGQQGSNRFMNILEVPISAIASLSGEQAVEVIHSILRAECDYAKLSPAALTISKRLTIADGGIDAEINVPSGVSVPSDCVFHEGITGFQIKAGASFKPWQPSAIRKELFGRSGKLAPEVERLLNRNGEYIIICTGHDLTPEQRNKSKKIIYELLLETKGVDYSDRIDVLGASQIGELVERYPGVASLLVPNPIHEALVLDEWKKDAHLSNAFEESEEQAGLISQIRAGLEGDVKHIRVVGEPGLGKTRIVLEALKDSQFSSYTLYVPNGSQFGVTGLFRQLLKTPYTKPLVLVIDELSEAELADIWRHLKPRCGYLKIITLDHGRDETYDDEIERLVAPQLSDNTIKKILADELGESSELDRWAAICEGSPRVAQAVSHNLRANPDDLFRSPTTIPIWSRFLHGYGRREEASARQIDCVTQYLALFSRFGFEAPVDKEAAYIADLVQQADPTIGWARFQEIVQDLRQRRVLQGSRTLFFVPKALHIYLWKQFWKNYGRQFDFIQTFNAMPESLHVWFMKMFKYAGDSSADHVIADILRPDGLFSDRSILTNEKGAQFLSTLSEANPVQVLLLLEATVGKWSDQELMEFKHNRQSFVWALEKIAVWPAYTVRAMQLLIRFAVNENSDYSNNSTGTLIGLFRIGPEEAVTESSPEERHPAMLQLLRATGEKERLLGLEGMKAAIGSHGLASRIIGPEYQGLKARAKLWMPKTYGEWWEAEFIYFQMLVNETKNWGPLLRPQVCEILLEVVKRQIKLPPCTSLAFETLEKLIDDDAMSRGSLNTFFRYWWEHHKDGQHSGIAKDIRSLERSYTRRNLINRFRRYVIDVNWMEWDEDFRERGGKSKSHAKKLVKALARRVILNPENLKQIEDLLSPQEHTPALWSFGEHLGELDISRHLLPPLVRVALESKHDVCLRGYMNVLLVNDPEFYESTITEYLSAEGTAWLGVSIGLPSKYNDGHFSLFLDALEKQWIAPHMFEVLRYGRVVDDVHSHQIKRLLSLLCKLDSTESIGIAIDLLDGIPLNDSAPFNSDYVYGIVSKSVPAKNGRNSMREYHWNSVCNKLIGWKAEFGIPLLDVLLTKMGEDSSLSYNDEIVSVANQIVAVNPSGAWGVVQEHFDRALPTWRGDLINWLQGGLAFDYDDDEPAIARMPLQEILSWIEGDPSSRARIIAHAVPKTLDDEGGGYLTRELLSRYRAYDGVESAISAIFHSGGWHGPRSIYLKQKRDKFRRWLASGYCAEITQWIESEIEYLDGAIESEEVDEERSNFN